MLSRLLGPGVPLACGRQLYLCKHIGVQAQEMARVVAQLGCDRGLHQHVPLRVQSVPVVGGVNVLVDTAM